MMVNNNAQRMVEAIHRDCQQGSTEGMSRNDFWHEFHSAWGHDHGERERRLGYNKEAWVYV